MNRFLWLLMLLLLVGTVVGAGWAFNNGAGPFAKDDAKAKPAEDAPPPNVVALGFVDGDKPVVKPLPLVQGRVVEVIAEGTEVKKGTTLLKLDSGMYEAAVKEAQAALEDSQEKAKQAKQLPEQQRLKELQQQKAITAAESERKAVQLERDDKLEQVKNQIKVSKNLLDSLEERLKQLDAKVAAEKAKLDELKLFQPQSEINRAQADVHAKEAQLDKAKWALAQCTLEAPSDGLVLRVTISAGETLVAGMPGQAPPLQFLPKGPKIVRAEILQEWARLVHVGEDVVIEDDTYHGSNWRGKVRSLSNWYAPKRERIIEPFMVNDVRTLECLVEVLEESPPLRIGQRVRVKIDTK